MQHIFEARDLLAKHRAQFFTENSLTALADISVHHTLISEAIADLLQQQDAQHNEILVDLLCDFALYSRAAGLVDEAIQKLTIGCNFFLEIKDNKTLYLLKTEIAHLLMKNNHFQQAQVLYREALTGAEEQKMDALKPVILLRMGDALRFQGKLDLAREAYSEAKALSENNDELLQADAKEALSHIARLNHDSGHALQLCTQALEQYKETKDLLGQINCHNTLGDLYFTLPDHGLARSHYYQAFSLAKNINDTQGVANAQLGLTQISIITMDTHSNLLQKIHEIHDSYRNRHEWLGGGNADVLLGNYYFLHGNKEDARIAYHRAASTFERINAAMNFHVAQNLIVKLNDDKLKKNQLLVCLDKKGAFHHA